MKYLITGATGFIGPYLIQRLTAMGHHCRCLVRPGSNTDPLKDLSVEFVSGDITEKDTLTGIAGGMDVLVHMATLGHMSNFTVSESRFEAVNVQGTINIMEAALAAGVKTIVHCSTVAAMGICTDNPATEKSDCFPHHPYGRSKLRAENEVLRLFKVKGLPAVIIRFSMVYGPGDHRDILKLTRLAKKGLFPKVGSRSKLTPLVHVEDAVSGILAAVANGKSGEIYLITNPQSEPFDKIREIIHTALGMKGFMLYVPEWPALIAASVIEKLFTVLGKTPPVSRKNIESTLADRVFSIEKAQRELDFNPKIDPENGLRETVDWYKTHGWV
ncbi:MAG: NAD-dependent epimerase/dehydratase family protein [Thermodesulfobacteriota bacterium]